MRLLQFCFLSFLCVPVIADQYSYRVSPQEYLFKSSSNRTDSVFDNYKTVDLGAEIGVGSDCGRIDFTNTLRASLRNILDTKYFADIGKNIIGSSPMLLTCYLSPTWCAILKHSQLGAHYVSQMRLDQCSLIDKYTDSRVEDFYRERQTCVRKSIEENGGDMERAMESCQGNKLWDTNLTSWSGGKSTEKVESNKLLESSAKWAGFQGEDSSKSVNLLKAFVGETIVSKGNVSVEYGSRQSALTPRTYLYSIQKATYKELCGRLVKKVEAAGNEFNSDTVLSEADLKSISPSLSKALVDRQSIRALVLLPPEKREEACQELSDAVSMTVFSQDLNRSLDLLTVMSQNPNLPDNRKREIEEKRKMLKDTLETTLVLQKERSGPLNTVLSHLNEEGRKIENRLVGDALTIDENMKNSNQKSLMDCADDMWCENYVK